MKKLIALFSTIILITILAPTVPTSADTTNLIKNGGFETLKEDGKPRDWTFVDGTYGSEFIISTVNPHNGNNAMKYYSEQNAIYITQRVFSLIGGTEYNLSFWLKAVRKKGNIKIKFEYYSVSGSGRTYIRQEERTVTVAENTLWNCYDMSFSLPDEGNAVSILFRQMSGGGEAYWDDILLTGESSDPGYPKPPLKDPLPDAIDLIRNGGFETLNPAQTVASYWGATGGWGGENVQISSADAYNGQYCVKVTTDSGGLPFVSQSVSGFESGFEYQIRAFIKSEITSGRVAFKFEPRTSDGKGLGEIISNPFVDTKGYWQQVAQTFRVPKNTASVNICLRLYGTGTVYFDEVSCFKTAEPQRIELSTDSVFYYFDDQNGTATANLNTEYYPELVNGTIDFKLKYFDKTLKSQFNSPIINGSSSFEYDLLLLSVIGAEYTIEAVLKNSIGEVCETIYQPIYKYNRPTLLRADGVFEQDGKVFDPIFAYHASAIVTYPYCNEAGINLLQSYGSGGKTMQEVLDIAHQNGIKLMIPLYNNMKPAAHPDNIESTIRRVNELKDHPAIFGWMVMDEPYAQLYDPEELLRISYKTIRDIPPSSYLYCGGGFKTF